MIASTKNIDLSKAWESGYSIGELWGFSRSALRAESNSGGQHSIIWGILSIVEYQVDRGAGHKYLRDRLSTGDWTAIGFLVPKAANSELQIVPPIENAQFGRKPSAIGNADVQYTDVRIVHSNCLA